MNVQRQDSLKSQLDDLMKLGIENGMYDAVDFIKAINSASKSEQKEYRVYYKTSDKTWDEWFEHAGYSLENAERIKKRIEGMEDAYDIVIRQV